MKQHYFIFPFFLLLIGCNREDSDTTTILDEQIEEKTIYHDSDIYGLVKNNQGAVIPEAIVTVSKKSMYTFSNGIFLFKDTKFNKAGGLIHVQASGYAPEYFYALINEGDVTHLSPKLQPLKSDFIFNSNDPIAINIDNRITLQFEKSAFRDKFGNTYVGTIHFSFKNADTSLHGMRCTDIVNRIKIFENINAYTIVTHDGLGNLLFPFKEATISVNHKNEQIALLDRDHDIWKEINVQETSKVDLSNMPPIAIGNLVSAQKISSKINGIADFQYQLTANCEWKDTKSKVLISQSGLINFYAPIQTQCSFSIENRCNENILSQGIATTTAKSQHIVLNDLNTSKLKQILSEVNTCTSTLNKNDLIYYIVNFEDNGTEVIYQRNNLDKIYLPECKGIKSASYFRADAYQYKINYFSVQENFVHFRSGSFCMNKVSGYINLDGKSFHLDSTQYTILRENNDVVITNFAGFLIQLNDVDKVGSYIPEVILFNNPVLTDCFDASCGDIITNIKEWGGVGQYTRIQVSGKIQGHEIIAEFFGILQ